MGRLWCVLLVAGCGGEPGVVEDLAMGAPDRAAVVDWTTMSDSPGSNRDFGVVDFEMVSDASATMDLGVSGDLAVAGDMAVGLRGLNDEFGDPATLARFMDLYPAKHETLDINASRAGWMTILPVAAGFNHWYSDNEGPLVYKTVTGNFVVETYVRAGRRSDATLAPRGQFNAVGIVIRDSRSVGPGGQMWVMYNLGFQQASVAREVKTTRPAMGASLSTLFLNDAPGGTNLAALRVCRLGDTFYFFHKHPGENAWVEEGWSNATTVSGNGAGQATPGTMLNAPLRFQRVDLMPTLQVGLMAGNWAAPLEVRGELDYVRFSEVAQLADCTANFPF